MLMPPISARLIPFTSSCRDEVLPQHRCPLIIALLVPPPGRDVSMFVARVLHGPDSFRQPSDNSPTRSDRKTRVSVLSRHADAHLDPNGAEGPRWNCHTAKSGHYRHYPIGPHQVMPFDQPIRFPNRHRFVTL